MTQEVIAALDEYLVANNYYAKASVDEETGDINTFINNTWKNRIEDALSTDLKKALHNNNLQLKQTQSIFDIKSDEQGATIFKSFLELTDQNETMNVVVNLIVNHNNAFIYLGTSHTHHDKYTGSSKTLGKLFTELKKSEQAGNFFHTKFYDLLYTSTASTTQSS